MKLVEALEAMMDGYMVVDHRGTMHRIAKISGFATDVPVAFLYRLDGTLWQPASSLFTKGWRKATQDELRTLEDLGA